jgi:double-strand break repair protein MRE11
MLPEFMNLVVWGHEHDSIPELIFSCENNFHVYYPGSTIATSLCEGEAMPKHVGILTV